MRCKELRLIISKIPNDFELVNIFIAILILKARFPIKWVPIKFRARPKGISSIRPHGFVVKGLEFVKQTAEFFY